MRGSRSKAKTFGVSLALFFGVSLVAFACGGGKDPKVGVAGSGEPVPVVKDAGRPSRGTLSYVATVTESTVGPLWASGETSKLVAWIGPPEAQERRLFAGALTAKGEPAKGGVPRALASVPIDVTALVVKPAGQQTFVTLFTALTDKGESLQVASITADGALRTAPFELTRGSNHIVWMDAVKTKDGSLVFWAEETPNGDANVAVAALGPDAKPRGVPLRASTGVTGWQVLATDEGAALVTVLPGGPAAPQAPAVAKNDGGAPSAKAPKMAGRTRDGALALLHLDPSGHPKGAEVRVAEAGASGDVEVVRSGADVWLAWTDRSGERPGVVLAKVDPNGGVDRSGLPAATGRNGELVGLVPVPRGVVAAWEPPANKRKPTRIVQFAHFYPSPKRVEHQRSLEIVPKTAFEMTSAPGGAIAVLATAKPCDDDCAQPAAPSLLRLSEGLEVVQREPLEVPGDPAELAWNLSCQATSCELLIASGRGESRVRALSFPIDANVSAKAAGPRGEAGPSLGAPIPIRAGESIADVAVLPLGKRTMVAILTQALDDAPEPHNAGNKARAARRARGAELSVAILEENGVLAGPPKILSTRAMSIGGIALAGSGKIEDGAMLAWVARENGDPEVHVTRLDKNGKRANDVQLTTTKGDASDVALQWVSGSYIVGWVDGRHGNGEVYATRVTPELQRVSREERVTTAPGDAHDLVLTTLKDGRVLAAWSDTRDGLQDHFGDVYTAILSPKDAKKEGPENRALATASHSRSPRLYRTSGGLSLAWLEDAPVGLEGAGSQTYGILSVALDDGGKPRGAASRWPSANNGVVTSFTVAEDGEARHAVVARATKNDVALDLVRLDTQTMTAALLGTLEGPPSMDPALSLVEGRLFVSDEGPRAEDRVLRAFPLVGLK